MSIRVDDEKRKKLKAIASLQGKTMSGIVEEMIDQYITEYQKALETESDLSGLMKLSESSFSEWDNPEDEVYDDL